MAMIQISLTREQLQIIKEALDYHLEGFSRDDAPTDWEDASLLRDFIACRLTLADFVFNTSNNSNID
jgi:hypothetical protein